MPFLQVKLQLSSVKAQLLLKLFILLAFLDL